MSNQEFIPASEFCDLVTDGTHDSPKKTEFGVKLVTSKNIVGGKLDLTSAYFISESDAQNINKRSQVHINDILLSMIGTVGEVALIEKEPDFVIKNVGLLKNSDPKKAKWLYYYLKSPITQNLIKDRLRGTTQQYIPLGELRNLPILKPNSEEHLQNTIDQLSSLDKKIQLNTQINQTLEQIAQALFKSWFVDFDPVRAKVQALSDGLSLEQAELAAMQAISGKTPEELTALSQTQPDRYAELAETAKAFPCEMVEVDGVEVPKGWEVTPLSGLFTLISGTQIPKEEHIYEAKEGYERFIQNRDYSSNNHITYVEISKKNKRCTEKDILIDRYGDAGKIRFGISGVYNIALAKIVLNDNNLTEYLRWFLMQPKQKAYFEQASGASTRASLNTSTFKGINVVIPSNFILNIFSKISNTYLDSLRNLKEENNTLMKTRDSLLPKLLKQDV